jgi:NDP-sugar pyrophosphorylase family protein
VKAVILAGGKGRRLAPYTAVLPKPLMPIGDMPILEIVLMQLRQSGFSEVILAVGHLAALIETYFGDGSKVGLKIRYAMEDQPLGTAGPLARIRGLDETFLVMNGDILTDIDYRALVDYHREQRAALTIAAYDRVVRVDFGVIEAEAGVVRRYIEKPSLSYLVSMGIYVFEPAVRRLIEPDEYLDFPDLVRSLLAHDEKVATYKFSGTWLDIGRQEDFADAQVTFEKERRRFLKLARRAGSS